MNKKKLVEQREEKVLTREEILGQCKKLATQAIAVPGWPGKVLMRNVEWIEFMELRQSAPETKDLDAMLVAATCVDLEVEDAYRLQQGHFMQFGKLLNAVNSFNTFDEQHQEQAIKN